ncbi:PREDICTED: anaphase-promoting complex subunit 2-like isoform X2 [Populus euphratica]|uniref:Anaphase-promoting complex subunit 2-like isoform X2 n=1 Tax=Populus euphratica TaxID=75702 RepID=A0AAJ6XC18_POPEU|nr:PREDICTED: anaphase-promoting complex subunit 2-like isoform X2 [Populus euphratica]
MVSSVLISNLPLHFPEIPHWYFKGRLEELSTIMDGMFNGNDDDSLDKDDMDLDGKGKMLHGNSAMDIDECYLRGKFAENNKLVKSIGMVARYLGSLGFTSTTESTYASAILLLLKHISYLDGRLKSGSWSFPVFMSISISSSP